MKQNQKKRFNNGRFNNRNARQLITRNTVFDSTGPCGKLRGTALQLFEKYQAGAKDAMMQNDIVLAQSCMQYADHYMRLQNQAIQNEQMARNGNQNQQNQAVLDNKEEVKEVKVEEKDELPVIELPESENQEEVLVIDDIKPVEKSENNEVEAASKPKRKPKIKKESQKKEQTQEQTESAE